jgi:hypothetical protein
MPLPYRTSVCANIEAAEAFNAAAREFLEEI